MAKIRYEMIVTVEEIRKYVVYAEEGATTEDIQTQAYDEGEYDVESSYTSDVEIIPEPTGD